MMVASAAAAGIESSILTSSNELVEDFDNAV